MKATASPAGSPALRRICRRNPSVSAREIDGETFLVPLDGNLVRMHRLSALNAMGAFIWEELDGKRDLAAIHRKLLERFEVTAEEARRDLFEFVDRLLAAGLIELVRLEEKE